jgi:hypothetical protein
VGADRWGNRAGHDDAELAEIAVPARSDRSQYDKRDGCCERPDLHAHNVSLRTSRPTSVLCASVLSPENTARRRCILDARHLRSVPVEASGTVAGRGFESFRSRVFGGTVNLAVEHFSQKCICVSPAMLSKEASRTRLEIDPEAELALEFDQAAELAKLLGVLFTAECREHPREIALRRDGRPESLA